MGVLAPWWHGRVPKHRRRFVSLWLRVGDPGTVARMEGVKVRRVLTRLEKLCAEFECDNHRELRAFLVFGL